MAIYISLVYWRRIFDSRTPESPLGYTLSSRMNRKAEAGSTAVFYPSVREVYTMPHIGHKTKSTTPPKLVLGVLSIREVFILTEMKRQPSHSDDHVMFVRADSELSFQHPSSPRDIKWAGLPQIKAPSVFTLEYHKAHLFFFIYGV